MRELIFRSNRKILTYNRKLDKLIAEESNFYNFCDVDNTFIAKANESINEHYKSEKDKADVYTGQIYISDNGNLVFQRTKMKVWLTNKRFAETLDDFKKEIIQIEQRENASPKDKADAKRSSFANTNYKRSYENNLSNIKDFRIVSDRIIIKDEKTVYYSYMGRLKRLNASKFWSSTLMNPVFSEIFQEARKDTVAFEKIMRVLTSLNSKLNYISNTVGYNDLTSLYCLEESKGFDLEENPFPKFVIKMIKANQTTIYNYCLLKKMGIKDINVFKKLLIEFNFKMKMDFYLVHYHKLLEEYYDGKNENVDLIFFNRLKSVNYFSKTYPPKAWTGEEYKKEMEGRDSLRMLYFAFRNRRLYPEVNLEPLIPNLLKKGLDDMHNYLARICRCDLCLIDYKEYDLSQSEKYEIKVDDYNFLMPRNSLELARLADVMNNCVAGYNLRINLDEVIVYATNSKKMLEYVQTGKYDNITDGTTIRKLLIEEGNYPSCIEIASLKNKETQAFEKVATQNYTFENNSPQDTLKEVTEKYFERIKVKTNRSFRDYELIF